MLSLEWLSAPCSLTIYYLQTKMRWKVAVTLGFQTSAIEDRGTTFSHGTADHFWKVEAMWVSL